MFSSNWRSVQSKFNLAAIEWCHRPSGRYASLLLASGSNCVLTRSCLEAFSLPRSGRLDGMTKVASLILTYLIGRLLHPHLVLPISVQPGVTTLCPALSTTLKRRHLTTCTSACRQVVKEQREQHKRRCCTQEVSVCFHLRLRGIPLPSRWLLTLPTFADKGCVESLACARPHMLPCISRRQHRQPGPSPPSACG